MMISLTIGYQEKNPKHSTAPIRNACPVRLSANLRLNDRPLRILVGGAGTTGITVMELLLELAAKRCEGRFPGPHTDYLLLAGVVQNLLDLRLGVGEQGVDVRVLVGEDRAH